MMSNEYLLILLKHAWANKCNLMNCIPVDVRFLNNNERQIYKNQYDTWSGPLVPCDFERNTERAN
jgi:hypothetical protein